MQRPNLPSILDYFCSLRMFCWFLVGTYDSESFRNTSSFWPKLGSQGQAVKIKNIQLFGKNILASLAAQYEIEWELLSHCVVLGGFKRVVQTLPWHVLQKDFLLSEIPYHIFYWRKHQRRLRFSGVDEKAPSNFLLKRRTSLQNKKLAHIKAPECSWVRALGIVFF